MPKLKVLSGSDVVKILAGFGFVQAAQKGSHIKLARNLPPDGKQILTIPLHTELDKGTLKAIFRQASKFVDEQELRVLFYFE